MNMFKTTKFRATVCWGSSQHPFIRESRWNNTCTKYAVEYTYCGPVAEPVGPSDFLPSGLDSPTRCLLCRQTRQQSKSRIFKETVLPKPLRFPKISNHLRQIQDHKSSSWSQRMKSLALLLHLFLFNPANCLFFNAPTILDLYSSWQVAIRPSFIHLGSTGCKL